MQVLMMGAGRQWGLRRTLPALSFLILAFPPTAEPMSTPKRDGVLLITGDMAILLSA